MTEDALNRLRKRDRPEVPPRDPSLANPPQAPANLNIPAPEIKEVKIPEIKKVEIPRYLDTNKPGSLEIETKQTTMRLERGISDRLQEICRQHGISREVLIEALIANFEKAEQDQSAILSDAIERNAKRVELANRKRAQTMIEKFGNVNG